MHRAWASRRVWEWAHPASACVTRANQPGHVGNVGVPGVGAAPGVGLGAGRRPRRPGPEPAGVAGNVGVWRAAPFGGSCFAEPRNSDEEASISSARTGRCRDRGRSCDGTASHRHARPTRRGDDDQRQAIARTAASLRRRDQGRRAAIETLVGTAHRAAEERAERAADHHRRRRLRRAQHLRRRDPDTDDGPHRQRRPALQPRLLHRAVLADARCTDHRAQPPLGRVRRDLRAEHRLPRLQQHHRPRQGHHRPHAQGQRLLDRLVRQGPQRAGLPGQPARPLRPMARRHGLRVLLRLRRRRHQPVAAEPVPQHHADLSVPG